VGSRFRLRLPLTVSILPAMLLRVDGEEYALPLTSIVESLRFEPGDGHTINHAGVLTWRDRVLPLLDVGHIFGTREGIRERGFVVLMEAEGKRRGLVADELTGIKEIVVKTLDPMVGHPAGISASTILGDGRVILILDPKGLASFEPFIRARRGGEAPAKGTGEVS
jgi:two-component system chemotaxis sensor kinase CheA